MKMLSIENHMTLKKHALINSKYKIQHKHTGKLINIFSCD